MVEILNELAPFLKVVGDVGIGVLMAVVVAVGFVYLLRFTIPGIEKKWADTVKELEARHQVERAETVTRFDEILERVEGSYRDFHKDAVKRADKILDSPEKICRMPHHDS